MLDRGVYPAELFVGSTVVKWKSLFLFLTAPIVSLAGLNLARLQQVGCLMDHLIRQHRFAIVSY